MKLHRTHLVLLQSSRSVLCMIACGDE